MKRSNQNGFSLIELITTIVLVGIAFPALLAFFVNIMDDSVENEIIGDAIILAHQKMEEIIADKNNPNRGYTYIQASANYPSEAINQFTRAVVVTDTTISGVSGTEISVIVSHSLIDAHTIRVFLTDY